jgi:hypothetical protein
MIDIVSDLTATHFRRQAKGWRYSIPGHVSLMEARLAWTINLVPIEQGENPSARLA